MSSQEPEDEFYTVEISEEEAESVIRHFTKGDAFLRLITRFNVLEEEMDANGTARYWAEGMSIKEAETEYVGLDLPHPEAFDPEDVNVELTVYHDEPREEERPLGYSISAELDEQKELEVSSARIRYDPESLQDLKEISEKEPGEAGETFQAVYEKLTAES